MSKSRPFRILALPLVRIPHGPLRVSGIKAALDASKVASSSGASSVSASAASTAGSTAGGSSTVAESTSATPAAPQGHGVAPEATEAPLVLYHVQQPDIPKNAGKQPLYQRALDKAADEWTKLSTKKPDSWMYWFWQKGEHMMDKIEYEEWALKNVHEGRGVKIAKEGETQEKIEIPLLRPSNSSLGVPSLLPKLHRSLLHRVPYHKKMMTRFLVFSPLTWPFAIIPIIPNFPLMYVLWRAWSHYKAWKGAAYLENLLKLGMIVEKPSKALDDIYANKPKAVTVDAAQAADTASDAPKGGKKAEKPPYHGMLLVKEQIPALTEAFDLRAAEKIDVARAIDQADMRAEAAEKTLSLQAEGASEKKA